MSYPPWDESDRPSGREPSPWFGKLPSGAPGIAGIRTTLELMLHVRMQSPEHFDALVAHVRQLSEGTAELLAELKGDDEVVYGDRAGECWSAYHDHGRWEDLLFVLGEFGAVERDEAAE
jgi:hypothetical protein